jgi:hypothetical protein
MHAILLKKNTGFQSGAMINRNHRNQPDQHEQIRDAVRAWAAAQDNQDVVAGLIIEEWERQGGAGLYFPSALSRKRQKLFRWLDSDTDYARKNILQLTPAILAVLPLEFRGRLIGQDCFMTRFAAMEKEISEAKQAVMLNAPKHQKLKEMSEGIVSIFHVEPDLAGPLMAMVTTMLGAL